MYIVILWLCYGINNTQLYELHNKTIVINNKNNNTHAIFKLVKNYLKISSKVKNIQF